MFSSRRKEWSSGGTGYGSAGMLDKRINWIKDCVAQAPGRPTGRESVHVQGNRRPEPGKSMGLCVVVCGHHGCMGPGKLSAQAEPVFSGCFTKYGCY